MVSFAYTSPNACAAVYFPLSCLFVEGPIGPVTFTGLSTSSINIQVDNGTKMADYMKFEITRALGAEDVCEILLSDPLNDCTDTAAKPGDNEYFVHAERTGEVFALDKLKAATLAINRKSLKVSFGS